MTKFIILIISLLVLTHCSIDNKSGIWIDKKNPDSKNELSKIDFDKKLTYEEFRKIVVLYGKKSKYPNLIKNNE